MIVTKTLSSPVVTNITATPRSFKIKANARVFKILSSFYSDPMGAIPRELGANAWDSHVKAGTTDTQFLVHAPNDLEPFFSVRDYGTGLSAEDIDHIYTTYFESTKTSDNDTDGCMGLGSKTPFNYTENFTVTSWFNGRKFVYNCFIAEDGCPSILPVYDEESDEHSGMEIQFAVKKDDIQTFVAKIRDAYFPFRHRPKIVGASIEYQERKYLYSGENWGLRPAGEAYEGGRVFMGNYSYPINLNSISTEMSKHPKYNLFYRAFRTGKLDLFFNIGDLEVAPNKEQLQYDANGKTTNAILAAMDVAMTELETILQKEIKSPTSLWEAMSLYGKYNHMYDEDFGVFKNIFGEIPVKFNGQAVTSSMQIFAAHALCGLVTKDNHYGLYGTPADREVHADLVRNYVVSEIRFSTGYRNPAPRMKFARSTSYSSSHDRKLVVFYGNGSNVKRGRIRHWFSTNHPEFVSGNKSDLTVYFIEDSTPGLSILKAHQKAFGWADTDLIDVESLPKPPSVPRTHTTNYRSTKGMIRVASVGDYGIDRHGRVVDQNYFEHETREIKDGETYYYIDTYQFDYVDKKGMIIDNNLFYQGLAYLIECKVLADVKEIYAVTKTNAFMKKVGKWINLKDLMDKTIKKNRKKIESLLHQQTLRGMWRGEEIDHVLNVAHNDTIVRQIANPKTREFLGNLSKYIKEVDSEHSSTYYGLYRHYQIKAVDHEKASPFVVDDVKKIYARFKKVFSLSNNLYYNTQISAFVEVFNFIDEKA